MLVYIAKNKVNNKVYIGITKRKLEKRIYEHLYFSKLEKYKNIRFYNSINKYGGDKLEWDILYECDTIEELLEKEKYYINLYNSINPEFGYNMLESSSFKNYKHTQLFKDKLSSIKTDSKRKKSSSKYIGVVFLKKTNQWSSRITINKKLTYISNSDSEIKAAIQYDLYIINNNIKKRKRNFNDKELNELIVENNITYKEKNSNKTSSYRGVHFNNSSKKWISQICIDNDIRYIGSFNNEKDAAISYNKYILENNLNYDLNNINMEYNPIESKFHNKRGKYHGVSKKRNRFITQIRHNKRTIHIGSYITEKDAAKAYNDYLDRYQINKNKNLIED
jgi:hypothetical protein